VQIYASPNNRGIISDISSAISSILPDAVIIGASTVGEVGSGRTLTGSTLLIISFFESSVIVPFMSSCSSVTAQEIGKKMWELFRTQHSHLAGILLLSTPLSVNSSLLIRGLKDADCDVPVFGGGAGDYAAMDSSWVFMNNQIITHGVAAVGLYGKELHIKAVHSLGWQPLSREMEITAADSRMVLEIDNEPALTVYNRYIDTPKDEDFGLIAASFPFLINRCDGILARVPVAVNARGALYFMADMQVGDRFKIGYGDPSQVIRESSRLHGSLNEFCPQGVLLFICGCRRYLLQEDSNFETQPFETIAPTGGFYTYGEFCGCGGNLSLLNATLLAVGFREGPPHHFREPRPCDDPTVGTCPIRDPYAHQHAKVVSSLVRFIAGITDELEKANHELLHLSVTDSLTQMYNRGHLMFVLQKESERSQRYGYPLSAIIIDIDHFKLVNDCHGHNAGDEILKTFASALKDAIRSTDTLGRWGGEEFLVIMPSTDLSCAAEAAEKIRARIQSTIFPFVGNKTASIGAAERRKDESIQFFIERADKALYEAKHNGRNRVVTGE
jgi:diguanylate cyclase (GGDEF)-like protein